MILKGKHIAFEEVDVTVGEGKDKMNEVCEKLEGVKVVVPFFAKDGVYLGVSKSTIVVNYLSE